MKWIWETWIDLDADVIFLGDVGEEMWSRFLDDANAKNVKRLALKNEFWVGLPRERVLPEEPRGVREKLTGWEEVCVVFGAKEGLKGGEESDSEAKVGRERKFKDISARRMRVWKEVRFARSYGALVKKWLGKSEGGREMRFRYVTMVEGEEKV